jgi:hypothetical protein
MVKSKASNFHSFLNLFVTEGKLQEYPNDPHAPPVALRENVIIKEGTALHTLNSVGTSFLEEFSGSP